LFVYRSAETSSISLTDLKNALLPYPKEVLKHEVFQSNVEGFYSISDLLYSSDPEALPFDKNSLAMVASSHYNFTRHFRPLFPRAPFAPLDAEVILEQRLFVYGIRQRFLLKFPVDTVGNNWIHQARGAYCYFICKSNEFTEEERRRRKIREKKKSKLSKVHEESCPTFSFRMEEGDFAFFNNRHWKASAQPCKDLKDGDLVTGKDYGLVYIGLFA